MSSECFKFKIRLWSAERGVYYEEVDARRTTVPGILVTRRSPDPFDCLFTLSHESSGFGLCGGFSTSLESLERLAVRLGTLADWTLGAAEVARAVQKRADGMVDDFRMEETTVRSCASDEARAAVRSYLDGCATVAQGAGS